MERLAAYAESVAVLGAAAASLGDIWRFHDDPAALEFALRLVALRDEIEAWQRSNPAVQVRDVPVDALEFARRLGESDDTKRIARENQ